VIQKKGSEQKYFRNGSAYHGPDCCKVKPRWAEVTGFPGGISNTIAVNLTNLKAMNVTMYQKFYRPWKIMRIQAMLYRQKAQCLFLSGVGLVKHLLILVSFVIVRHVNPRIDKGCCYCTVWLNSLQKKAKGHNGEKKQ